MRILLLNISFLLFHVLCSGQNSQGFRLQLTLPGEYVKMAVDPLQQLYLISSNGQLKKINAKGDSLAVFNEFVRFGKKAEIDVANPLRTLIYYPEYANLVLLDRMLSKRAVLNLHQLGFFQVGLTAQSYENSIWLHDLELGQLTRVNEAGVVQDRFTDLRKLFDSVPQPTSLIDQGGILYLYDPRLGFYIFDHYGSFKKRIPLYGWKDVNIVSGILLGWKNDKIYRYDPIHLELKEISIPGRWRNCLQLLLSQDHIFVLFNDRLEIYAITG